MNLETIIQSKVNQREKTKYDILTHVYGIQKDGTDEPIGRAAMEMQTQVTDLLHRGGEGECGMDGESSMGTYTLSYVKQTASGTIMYDSANSNQCSVTIQRGGLRGSRRKVHVYPWLIHVVQQKPTKYCETIIL